MRYDFGSDNTAGMAPAALDAIVRENDGFARAYGADDVTARAADLIRERLDADADVRFVFSGTAANSVALAMLAWPHEAVLAHHAAHICTDETGAPGFFGSGVGLVGLPGFSGKIDPMALREALAEPEVGHRQPPAALSLTQSTEYGTVYTEEELRHLIEPVKLKGYGVHMDGARLANAAAAGFDLKHIARLGVDVLVFGGAKAGANCAEAIVMFDKSLARRRPRQSHGPEAGGRHRGGLILRAGPSGRGQRRLRPNAAGGARPAERARLGLLSLRRRLRAVRLLLGDAGRSGR